MRHVVEPVAELCEGHRLRVFKRQSESIPCQWSHLPRGLVLGFLPARYEAHVHAAMESELGATVLR